MTAIVPLYIPHLLITKVAIHTYDCHCPTVCPPPPDYKGSTQCHHTKHCHIVVITSCEDPSNYLKQVVVEFYSYAMMGRD